jgi:hypothetical protein
MSPEFTEEIIEKARSHYITMGDPWRNDFYEIHESENVDSQRYEHAVDELFHSEKNNGSFHDEIEKEFDKYCR